MRNEIPLSIREISLGWVPLLPVMWADRSLIHVSILNFAYESLDDPFHPR